VLVIAFALQIRIHPTKPQISENKHFDKKSVTDAVARSSRSGGSLGASAGAIETYAGDMT
jgi:hypothetical protein